MENLGAKEVENNQELEAVDYNDNNIKKLINHLYKKGFLSANNPAHFIEKDEEVIEFIVTLMHDREFIRKLLHRYDRKTRVELVLTCDMNKIERFIFMSFFNHFRKEKFAKENGETIKKILAIKTVIANVFIYHPNAHFYYTDLKKLWALARKLKAKAYYHAIQDKGIDKFLTEIKKRKKNNK
jgi:predicted transcriptional regulator